MPAATAQGPAQCSGSAFANATTADGSVVLAPHFAYGIFTTSDATPNNAAADLVRNTLLAAGWTLSRNIQAVGYINAPFGWGFTAVYNTVVTIIIPTSSGPAIYHYVFYDPTTQAAPTGLDVVPVIVGATSAASQANLLAHISAGFGAGGALTAVASGPNQITITSKLVGTLGNAIQLIGNGSNSTGVNPSDGGWELQSRTQHGVFGLGNTAQILITATTGVASNRLALSATIGGVTIGFNPEAGGWSLIADDFQCCFFSLMPFHAGDIYVFNSFLWASTLYIPPNIPLSFAGFIMQANSVSTSIPSLGAPNGNAVDSFVGGYHTSGSVGQQGWSIGMYHSESGMVADPTGTAILQTPHVFLPCGYNGESRICGQLFDALASSGPNTYAEQFTIANYNYRVIATQTDPPGSLFLCTGEVSNAGTASGSNPKAPSPTHPAPPQSAVGSGDVSDVSPYTGQMAIISSTSVPDSTWVGRTIIIGLASGPTSFTVTLVPSASEIEFTPAAPAGTTFNAPFSLSL